MPDSVIGDGPRCFFRTDGETVLPLPAAAGPWTADALSGTTIGALVAAYAERIETPSPMLTVRICIEFLRPVPMSALQVRHEVIREGRKQQVLRIYIDAFGKTSVTATVQRLRVDSSIPSTQLLPSGGVVDPAFQPPAGSRFAPTVNTDGAGSGSLAWVDSSVTQNNQRGPGVSEAWFRFDGRIFDDVPLTPLTRAAFFSDFGNGMAPIVDASRYTYMNADLTLHLARLPRGEWIHLQCRTLDGGDGLGMVETLMGDALGPIGWAHQALLLERC